MTEDQPEEILDQVDLQLGPLMRLGSADTIYDTIKVNTLDLKIVLGSLGNIVSVIDRVSDTNDPKVAKALLQVLNSARCELDRLSSIDCDGLNDCMTAEPSFTLSQEFQSKVGALEALKARSEFQCPICYDTCFKENSGMLMCENTHYICGECSNTLFASARRRCVHLECPVCRGNYSERRVALALNSENYQIHRQVRSDGNRPSIRIPPPLPSNTIRSRVSHLEASAAAARSASSVRTTSSHADRHSSGAWVQNEVGWVRVDLPPAVAAATAATP